MATSAVPIFSGQSSFAADFQQVLTRAVGIASLPIRQMQSEVSTLQSQQQALAGMEAVFISLRTAIQSVNSGAQSTITASVSDSSAISATASADALLGTYSIQVDQLGSATTTLSSAGPTTISDASSGNISPASSFMLTVNGTGYAISPSGSSLNALATAINNAGAGVQATIVNVGGSAGADYRLALTGTKLATDSIQLNDGTADLMDPPLITGSPVQYRVYGSTTEVQSDSRQITLAPGLTINLLKQSASPVIVTVAQSNTKLSSSLSAFVSAYNATVDALGQEYGQNAGPLSGQSVLRALSASLNSMASYSPGSGSLSSLADLGLDLDSSGHLSFDPTTFNSQSVSDIQQFLGDASSGGFLQVANNALTSAADPATGAIQNELNTLQGQVTHQNDLIAQQQLRVTDLQNGLMQRLSEADAIIANLQAQKAYFTELFQAQYPANGTTG